MTPIIFSLVLVFVTWIPDSECSRKCGYSASTLAKKRTIGRSYEHSNENEIDELPKADRHKEVSNENEIDELPKANRHKEVMLFGIVGGSEAGLGEFPWMVSLQVHQGGKLWQHICGGSLLAPDWILTASHCKPQMEHSSVRAVAGCHKWRTNGEFDCQVSEFDVLTDMTNHEEFDLPTFNNDISLIHLKKPFRSSIQRPAAISLIHLKKPFRSSIQRRAAVTNICIPPKGTIYSGMATVAGWGNLSYKGRIAERLMMVDVRILRPSDCAVYPNFRPGLQLCAGFVQGVKDACSGDSGGPLVMSIGPHTYQIGIVSSGRDCAKAGYPGIYTDVASYRSWIQSKSGLQLD